MAEVPSSVGLINIINLMREENNARNEAIKQSQEGTEKNTSDLNKTMRDILEEIKQDRLQSEEDRRENKKQSKDKGKDSVSPMKQFEIDWPSFGWTAFMGGIMAALKGFIAGLLVGWVGGLKVLGEGILLAFKQFFKAIGGAVKLLFRGLRFGILEVLGWKWVKDLIASFRANFAFFKMNMTIGFKMLLLNPTIRKTINLIKGMGEAFQHGLNNINRGIRGVNGAFRSLNKADKFMKLIGRGAALLVRELQYVKMFWQSLKNSLVVQGFKMLAEDFRKLGQTITNGFKTIKGFFITVKGFFSTVGKQSGFFTRTFRTAKIIFTEGFRALGAIFKPVTTIFNAVFGKAGVLGRFFGTIFKAFAAVGKAIAWPITVIMGIYDGIMGFIKGWNAREGEGLLSQIIGGVSGALGGILSGLIGVPLDLLKSAVGWIAGKLGFENFAEWLKSFSFADLISDMFNGLGQMFIDIKDWVVGFFAAEDPVGYIIDGLTGAINKITGFFSDMWESITSLLSRAWRGRPALLGGDGSFSIFGSSSENDAIGNDTPPDFVNSGVQRRQAREENRSNRSGGTSDAIAESGTAQDAVAFFMDRGWSHAQASGIVGNLLAESNLDPHGPAGDGGKAYGIAQWHPDRQATFAQWAGKDIRDSSLAEQLQFVDWELRNSEKAAGDRLARANTAEDAAAIIDEYYERSAGIHRERRIDMAQQLVGGRNLPTNISPAPGSSRTNAGTMLAQAGNMSGGNGGNAFASFNFGGNSNTSVSNTSNMQSVIAPAFDIDAAFGPFATSANALFGAA